MATAELTTAVSTPAVPPTTEHRRLFTAADLEHFPAELPSGLVEYELFDGELIMMNRPGARHGSLQARIAFELIGQGERLGHGTVYTETGLLLQRNPDRVLGPDVSFIARGIFPIKTSAEGFLETRPSLAVEIRSKNDSRTYMEGKGKIYLDEGVQIVWLVDPDSKSVTVLRANQAPEVITEQQVLTSEDIIPGFRMNLVDLFRD